MMDANESVPTVMANEANAQFLAASNDYVVESMMHDFSLRKLLNVSDDETITMDEHRNRLSDLAPHAQEALRASFAKKREAADNFVKSLESMIAFGDAT